MKYIAKYPNEKLWEEEWKREYKYGVFLFIPPNPVKTLVNKLRQKYDPISYESCTAHISLTMPLMQPLTHNKLQDLKSNIQKFQHFKVTYGPIINFLPVAPGVVFKINEQKFFEKLYKYIESTPGLEFYKRKWPFKAHLSVAEFLDDETTIKLTEELNKSLKKETLYGDFMCKNITYMVPDQGFCFQEIVTVDLGK